MMYYFMSKFVSLFGISIFATTALICGISVLRTCRFFGICNNTVMSEHILLFGISVFASAALIRGMSVRCTRRLFSVLNGAVMSEHG